jgi:hypothetical protein
MEGLDMEVGECWILEVRPWGRVAVLPVDFFGAGAAPFRCFFFLVFPLSTLKSPFDPSPMDPSEDHKNILPQAKSFGDF